MGKYKSGRWGNQSSSEPFAMVPKRMLKSQAWKDLPFSAMMAWIYLKAQKTSNDCNEHIQLPYNSVADVFSTKTYSDAIKILFGHGFLDIEERGGLMKRPTVYRLIDEWENWEKGKRWNGEEWVDEDTLQYNKSLKNKVVKSRHSFKK